MKRILIFGLPGSGKTTLAEKLSLKLPNVLWLNADNIRKSYDDWDFSMAGRLRQVERLYTLSNASSEYDYVICDFVAPTEEIREIFNADYSCWMDTISKGRFDDTNELFEKPSTFDYRITTFNDSDIDIILNKII